MPLWVTRLALHGPANRHGVSALRQPLAPSCGDWRSVEPLLASMRAGSRCSAAQDVIGMVGFGKDFGATRCPPSAPRPPTAPYPALLMGRSMRRGPCLQARARDFITGWQHWCPMQRTASRTACEECAQHSTRARAASWAATAPRPRSAPSSAAWSRRRSTCPRRCGPTSGSCRCAPGASRLLHTRLVRPCLPFVSVRLSVLSSVLFWLRSGNFRLADVRLVQRWRLILRLRARACLPHAPQKQCYTVIGVAAAAHPPATRPLRTRRRQRAAAAGGAARRARVARFPGHRGGPAGGAARGRAAGR